MAKELGDGQNGGGKMNEQISLELGQLNTGSNLLSSTEHWVN